MIYFDNAATTRPLQLALKEYEDISATLFANPSSGHLYGISAHRKLEQVRDEMLRLLKLEKTHDLIFTSGASESNNLALKGAARQYANRGKRLITNMGEHSSVLNPLRALKEEGFEVVFLPITSEGRVDPETLKGAMDKSTTLVSVMSVNNEVGSYNDLKAIAEVVHSYPKAYLLVDATQSMGKDDIDLSMADLISFSAHKFGGTKGVGALIYRKNIKLHPEHDGGGQEHGFRSGTVNLAGNAAMAVALRDSLEHLKENREMASALKKTVADGLADVDEVVVNSPEDSSPYILNISLLHKKSSVIIEALGERGIYVSSHTACDARRSEPSSVLLAMGLSQERAENSIRISFSHDNTIQDGVEFVAALKQVIEEVKDR